MKLYVLVSSIDYETYNEFHSVYSTLEKAKKGFERMCEFYSHTYDPDGWSDEHKIYAGGREYQIIEVGLDEDWWDER